jgi:hypothetical protein
VIATNEAVDVLRHGWQDAATTLAADVPEVAELLQARLEMAVATDRLNERHLLDTIQEVESVTSRAGSPSGQMLARRLRRTVYEYLLALDAARPLETAKAPVDQPATAEGSPMVGAEEVAALGHASRARAGTEEDVAEAEGETFEHSHETEHEPETATLLEPADELAVDAEQSVSPDATTSRRRFARRRRRRQEATAEAQADVAAIETSIVAPAPAAAELSEADATEPNWQFTPAAEPAAFDGGLEGDLAADDSPAGDVEAPAQAAMAAPAAEPEHQEAAEAVPDVDVASSLPVASTEEAGDPTPTFVAPRAGFHIVEDAPPHRADQEEARLEMPPFSADEESARQPQSGGELENVAEQAAGPAGAAATDGPSAEITEIPPVAGPAPAQAVTHANAGSDFLAWQPPIAPHAADQVPVDPESASVHTPSEGVRNAAPAPAPVPQQPAPASAPVAPVPTPTDEEDGESRGWGVRKHGEAHSTRRGAPAIAPVHADDDPFENNTRLSDMRRRIEERLRRKRCDEAAALLQEIAQETGGRAVAELAMNVGDRCRALGKSNAALNCYLAAARSDPVYELPLSRLADICIDNQDTELAVSYLERIARIYRFREDDRAALRTYRRIATIAPYREDVLTLLMNAQRTGQLQ